MSQQPPDRPPEGWGPPPEGPPVPPQGWGPAPGEPTQRLPEPPGQAGGQQFPGQQGWSQPGQQGPLQTAQKRSTGRKLGIGCLGIVGLLIVLGIIGALAGGGDDGGSATATDDQASATTRARTKTTTSRAQQPEPAAGIGDPVRDGKFEFVVRKVDCGKTRIGDQYLNTKALGKFCLVSMRVTNIGKESQTLDASSQYMYGSGGRRFDADGEASIYLEESKTFLEDINPGNAVNGIVVFDIPKNQKPTKIELHDSPFSGRVTVEL